MDNNRNSIYDRLDYRKISAKNIALSGIYPNKAIYIISFCHYSNVNSVITLMSSML
ncbi:hypothetical protein CNEO4_150011 [Clostridium neonatale]|nr:hypothetical protein CNEO4_150011 [Clostridium neonatale]